LPLHFSSLPPWASRSPERPTNSNPPMLRALSLQRIASHFPSSQSQRLTQMMARSLSTDHKLVRDQTSTIDQLLWTTTGENHLIMKKLMATEHQLQVTTSQGTNSTPQESTGAVHLDHLDHHLITDVATSESPASQEATSHHLNRHTPSHHLNRHTTSQHLKSLTTRKRQSTIGHATRQLLKNTRQLSTSQSTSHQLKSLNTKNPSF